MYKQISLCASLCFGLALTPSYAQDKTPAKKEKKKKKTKDIYNTKQKIESALKSVHPFFALENIDTLGGDDLKVGGMCFDKDVLYIVTLSPDRTNKRPDHQGKVLRVENVTTADGKNSKIKITPLVTGLYEPCAIAVVEGHVYVGTKTQILRFDNATKSTKAVGSKDGVVLVDGTSTVNFHTYTVGFEKYIKEGKTYLCGNFTTAILSGGKRDKMIPPNPKVNRGSNFILGPITGSETADTLELEYFAGGFRTPNGIEVGPENEVYVADNQGVFNPSNELIRIQPGSFYGHYLYNEDGRAAAHQPKEVDPTEGSPLHQKPATVHLPQGTVARSPAQPHVIRNRKGVLAPYNGQILLCEFTTGSLLRVSMEEVEGVWQGVVFTHSGGPANADGTGGFTAGPNRIEEGPDGNFYIGQIGAGRLWEYNGRPHGLQRLRVKSQDEVDATFNEILNVKVADTGFEVEFLKPLDAETSLDPKLMKASQWTYTPTNRYGGSNVGTETLTVSEVTLSPDRKKAILKIEGLKDGDEQFVIKKGKASSHNTGWVVKVELNPQTGKNKLYTDEFHYTLHKKIGGNGKGGKPVTDPLAIAKTTYLTNCVSCHEPPAPGVPRGAPDLKGLLGRKQTVLTFIKKDGVMVADKEVEVKVDRNYIINALITDRKQAEALVDYISTLKKK